MVQQSKLELNLRVRLMSGSFSTNYIGNFWLENRAQMHEPRLN